MGDEDAPRWIRDWATWCDKMMAKRGLRVGLIFGWPLFIIGPIWKAVLYVMTKIKKRRMRRRELRQRKACEKVAEAHRQKSNPLRNIKRNLQV